MWVGDTGTTMAQHHTGSFAFLKDKGGVEPRRSL